MRRLLAFGLVLLVAACGGDDGGASVDAPVDAVWIDDGAPGDGPIDSASIDGASTDASGVDGTPTNLGPVDCRVEADCPGLSSCTVTAPGGVCNGCGTDDDCPTGTTCGQVGACVRDCNTDAECSVGKRCNQNGQCVIRQCSVSVQCPAPYVCGGSLCQRPACGVGGTCPAPMTCGTGNICVEP
jgi:hypothetical protein